MYVETTIMDPKYFILMQIDATMNIIWDRKYTMSSSSTISTRPVGSISVVNS